jgi:hypothetical protein
MNYSLIDSILDDFQKVFKEIKVKDDLTNATIERWRWDLPEISLIWRGRDAIWRNIHVLLDTERTTHEILFGQIEINAWLDGQKDNRWIRRWRHEVIIEEKIMDMHSLWAGYETVNRWTAEVLTNEKSLSEVASAFLDHPHS